MNDQEALCTEVPSFTNRSIVNTGGLVPVIAPTPAALDPFFELIGPGLHTGGQVLPPYQQEAR